MSEQGWPNAVYKDRWIELPATLGANLAIWTYKPDDWRALEPDLRLIHYTMKKPFQGCDDKHAPICARWHAARAAMDAADRRNDAIAAAHPATLVTGYWSMLSKHSEDDYRGWIANFLRIRAPTVIFSAPNAVEQFRRDRAALGLGNLTRVVAKDIDQFHTHKAFAGHFRDHFARLDPERGLHKTPRLYAVWAEKLELLEVARRRRFFGPTTAFFWIDIGIFRDRGPDYHLATNGRWPEADRVAAIVASGRVAMTSVRPSRKRNSSGRATSMRASSTQCHTMSAPAPSAARSPPCEKGSDRVLRPRQTFHRPWHLCRKGSVHGT